MTALDVLEFVRAADLDHDGNISYRELADCLADPVHTHTYTHAHAHDEPESLRQESSQEVPAPVPLKRQVSAVHGHAVSR